MVTAATRLPNISTISTMACAKISCIAVVEVMKTVSSPNKNANNTVSTPKVMDIPRLNV